jgi:hypothetical protein
MNTATELAALRATVEAFMEASKEDRAEAKDFREKAESKLNALQADQAELLRRMNKVEPVADMVSSWKAKVAGALLVLGLIGGVMISAITFFKDKLLAFLGWA